MKKIILLLLAIITVLSIVSCDDDKKKPSTTPKADHTHVWGDWETVTDATCTEEGEEKRTCECGEEETKAIDLKAHTYKETVTEPTFTSEGYTTYTCEVCGDSYKGNEVPSYDLSKAFNFVKDKNAMAYIVVSDSATSNTKFAVNKLIASINNITGVSLKSGNETGNEYEILIGDTGRAESTALKATLSADQYAIKLEGKKIVIVATHDAFLYDAVKCFIDTYLVEGSAIVNDANVVLGNMPIDVKGTGDKNTLRYKLTAGTTNYSATVEEFTTAKNEYYKASSTTIPYRRQGGCFNGEKYYQSLITKNEEYGRIMMKNVVTGETMFSEPMSGVGHMNDMDYNPDLNEVLVANGSKIMIFDGDTLEYKRTEMSNVSASASLAYDPIGHKYIVGYYQFKESISDATVKQFGHSSEVNLGNYNAKQGSGSDGCYVVSLLAHSKGGRDGGYNCHVVVYDMDGNYLGLVDVYIKGGLEPENVSVVDGVLYIGTCTSQPVATLYKVVLG